MLTARAAPEGFLNDGGKVLGPDKGPGVSIPFREIAFDVADERPHRVKGASPHRLARENAEPCLDQVEPRGALRREMEMHVGMGGQPGLHGRGRMRGGVVQNDVQLVASVEPPRPSWRARYVRTATAPGATWRS